MLSEILQLIFLNIEISKLFIVSFVLIFVFFVVNCFSHKEHKVYTRRAQSIRIIFFFLFVLIKSISLHAETWYVAPGKSMHSIQQALGLCKNGDTIVVDAGKYSEKSIVIDKSVTLIGENNPVLDGENKFEVISIKADDVTVQGFTIQHCGASSLDEIAGIKIYGRKNVIIKNNNLLQNFFGVYAQFSTNCSIENNKVQSAGIASTQTGNAIHCFKCDSMRIIANTVTGHRDGIYFEFVNNSIIWRNTSEENIRYGLHFMTSHNNAYICNIFRSNGAGVAVMYSHGVKMYNNFFEDNRGTASYGLLIKELTDSYINGNLFITNTAGIFMEGGTRINMQKNVFRNNGWALRIQASCSDVRVSENNFTGNTFDVTTNGSLVLNTFNENYWDKYEGYDLNKDGSGDIPYRPVSLYSMVVEQNPPAVILFRSMIVSLLDRSEKIFPSLTPGDLKDNSPHMKPLPL